MFETYKDKKNNESLGKIQKIMKVFVTKHVFINRNQRKLMILKRLMKKKLNNTLKK